MTILRGLVTRSAPTGTPTSVEHPAVPLTSDTLMSWLTSSMRNDAGVVVTERSALSLSACWRCVNLLSSLSGALPLHAYNRESMTRVTRVVDDPHPELTALEFYRLLTAHRALWGNSYAQKVRARSGELRWLFPIRPERVRVHRSAPSPDNPSGKWFEITTDSGEREVLTTREVWHVPGFGYDGASGLSPIAAARQAIGMGIAAEQYGARLWSNGALMAGILRMKNQITQTQADEMRKKWRDKTAGLDHAHDVPILDNGAEFHQLTMPNTDAQFIESRRFQTSEIGRFYGLPPFLMGETEKSTSWGTGLEQQAQGFVVFDLHPTWLAPVEQRVTKELLVPEEHAKYALQGLLRGDSKARATYYRTMREIGALSANEVRALEELPGVEGGDTYMQPGNMQPLGSEGDDDPDDDGPRPPGEDD